jgi:hypothetical protein
MYDRASAIAEKYLIIQQFHVLLKIQPGVADEWDPFTRDGKFLRDLQDTFVRLMAAIENQPPFSETRRALKAIWEWLDKRNIAKWIVVVILGLVALAILKRLGYDLPRLIDLVKAVRGEK